MGVLFRLYLKKKVKLSSAIFVGMQLYHRCNRYPGVLLLRTHEMVEEEEKLLVRIIVKNTIWNNKEILLFKSVFYEKIPC